MVEESEVARGSVMADDGCVVGLCAGIHGPIVVEAVRDMRPDVALPFQALECDAFLVGRQGRPRNGPSRPRTARRCTTLGR